MKKPIPRGEGRFDKLSNEPPAIIPLGYRMPLEVRTTRELIAEREEWLQATDRCPTCKGHGRIAKLGHPRADQGGQDG
jgi:hypothetical protein